LLNSENTNVKEDNMSCLPDFNIDHNREILKELYAIGLEMQLNYFVLGEFSENAVALVVRYVVQMVSCNCKNTLNKTYCRLAND